MERLKNLHDDVPEGWFYTQAETGYLCRGATYGELLRVIKDHRVANGLPIGPSFQAEIQDAICKRLPPRSFFCEGYDESEIAVDAQPRKRRTTTIEDAKGFIRVMTELVRTGAGFEPKEEAERRARICSTCPLNVKIAGCSGCRNLVGTVTQLIGRRSTRYDDVLNGCEVCGCELKTAVHTDLAAQQSVITAEMNAEFPDYCWKKKPVLVFES